MKKIKRWKGLVFVLPSLMGVIIFYLIPFVLSTGYCFTQGVMNRKFVGLRNFRALFKNEAYRIAIKNTGLIIGLAVPILCSLAIVVALVIERNLKKYRYLQGWLLIPLALPSVSLILVWRDLLNSNGILSGVVGYPVGWLESRWGPFVLIGLIIWKNLGYDVLLVLSSLLTLPKEYEDAASLEGAGRIRIALSIKIPQLVPMLFFMGIISLLNSFKIFREIYLLRGEYPSKQIYLLQHFMNNQFKDLNYEMLTTSAFILYLLIFFLIFFITRWQQRYMECNI